MNKSVRLLKTLLGFAVLASVTASVGAQNAGTQAVQARMLVTVEAHRGSSVPEVTQQDVMVHEGRDRDQVTGWVPAQGDNAALELFIVLDDGSGLNLGSQLEGIRKFIMAQPASAAIGVAYMRNGVAKVEQSPTSDHGAAANALRLPLGIGGINASPYLSISDLIKRWPESRARHVVIVASDGIDPYYGVGDLQDPYLDAAIDDAVRAGVVIYGIYTPGAGHFGHGYWANYWGQIYLSRIGEETGGESFYLGSGPPPSFDPYLDDVARHLGNQYLLTFLPKPQKKSGWQRVKITTEVSNAEMVSAPKVYVQANMP